MFLNIYIIYNIICVILCGVDEEKFVIGGGFLSRICAFPDFRNSRINYFRILILYRRIMLYWYSKNIYLRNIFIYLFLCFPALVFCFAPSCFAFFILILVALQAVFQAFLAFRFTFFIF